MKRNRILLGTLLLSFLFSLNLSAQHHNGNRNNDRYNDRYDYDDTVIIIHDDNRRDHRNQNYRRDSERRWKARIMDRAIRIAEADGHISRRERKELRALEADLGIHIREKHHHRH